MCVSKRYVRDEGEGLNEEGLICVIIIFGACSIPLLICGLSYGDEINASYRYHVNAKITSVQTVNHIGGSNVVYNVVGSDNSTCVVITEVDPGQLIYQVNDTISITPLDVKAGTCAIYIPNGNNAKSYLIVVIVFASIMTSGVLAALIYVCVKKCCCGKYYISTCKNCCKCYMVCCDEINSVIGNNGKTEGQLPTYQSIS